MKSRRFFILLSIGMTLLILSGCAAQTKAATIQATNMAPVDMNLNPQYIIAEGKVLPKEKATLSFTSSGVVDNVYFQEGETLKKGDTIANLSGSESMQAAVAGAELVVLTANQNLNTFMENEALNRANAEVKLADAQAALDDAKDNRERKDLQRASETTLDGLRADFILAQDDLNDWEKEYNSYEVSNLVDTPEAARVLLQLTQARKAYEKTANNLNYALGFPDANEIAKADAQLSLAQADLDKAQADYDAVKDGPDPDQLEILQSNQKVADAQLASAKKNLQDLYLDSPFDATLVSSNLEEGEFISAGAPAVQIGNLNQWIIETTDLTELDIVYVHVGDKVSVQFDALPGVEISGTVDKIKMLGEDSQGDVVYTVTVIPDEAVEGLRWNMTAFMKISRE